MKKKNLFIFTLIFMLFLIVFVKGNQTKAQEQSSFLKNAKSAILIELNTGEILYEKNIEEKRSPASMTKILSIHLVLEALDKGQIKWNDIVTVSEHAAGYGGSQVYLEPGEQMSVEDLYKCMMIASANDATVALAELVAGSEELFVQRMNDRIKELGLKNTVFKDPTGLTDYEEITLKYSSMYEDYIREDTNNRF